MYCDIYRHLSPVKINCQNNPTFVCDFGAACYIILSGDSMFFFENFSLLFFYQKKDDFLYFLVPTYVSHLTSETDSTSLLYTHITPYEKNERNSYNLLLSFIICCRHLMYIRSIKRRLFGLRVFLSPPFSVVLYTRSALKQQRRQKLGWMMF